MRRVVKEKQRVSGDSRDTKQIRGRAASEKCAVAEAGNRISALKALKVYDSFLFFYLNSSVYPIHGCIYGYLQQASQAGSRKSEISKAELVQQRK